MLRRRGLCPRGLVGVPLLVGLLAAVAAVGVPAAVAAAPAADPGTPVPSVAAGASPYDDDPLAETGPALYQLRCAVCHGTSGEGRPGEGIQAGPPLQGLPVAYVDLTLRTGRMPLAYKPAGVPEDRLADDERAELVAWAEEALALEGGIPEVGAGDPAQGQVVYQRHCAACHGASGGGGIAGGGTQVPPVHDTDAVAVVEAVRVGPFEMPAFDDQVVSEEEADDVAAYVTEVLAGGEESPLGISEVSPTLGAVLTVLLSALALGAVVLVDRTGRRRQVQR